MVRLCHCATVGTLVARWRHSAVEFCRCGRDRPSQIMSNSRTGLQLFPAASTNTHFTSPLHRHLLTKVPKVEQ